MSIIISKHRSKYKIDRDPHCWTLEKLRKGSKGEEVWDSVGYFTDLLHVTRKLVNLNVMQNAEHGSIQEIVTRTCDSLTKQLRSALKEQGHEDDKRK